MCVQGALSWAHLHTTFPFLQVNEIVLGTIKRTLALHNVLGRVISEEKGGASPTVEPLTLTVSVWV